MNRDIIGSDDHFRHLFNSMQEGFAFHEVVFDDSGKPTDYRYIEVNPAFERLTGKCLARELSSLRCKDFEHQFEYANHFF